MRSDFSSSFADVFDDLFGEFMGGGRRRGGGQQGGQRGSDLRYNMEITLEEAYLGKQAKIRVPTHVSCDTCSGSGAKDPNATASCQTCGGYGKVRAQQGFLFDRTHLPVMRRRRQGHPGSLWFVLGNRTGAARQDAQRLDPRGC